MECLSAFTGIRKLIEVTPLLAEFRRFVSRPQEIATLPLDVAFAVSLLAVEGPTRAIEHSFDLARHDEIVLVQSLDLLGTQRDGRVTPAEADVGVMAFGLGELTDFLNKGERFAEIAESKRALDAMGIVSQLPIGSLCP
jgi:hypothetical protein